MRFFCYGLPPIVLAALLFTLSSQSTLPTPDVTDFDKFAHVLAFGSLSFLIARGLGGYGVRRTAALLGAVALTVAYGATDELHQSFVPGRSPDIADLLADTAGALIAAFGWWRWMGRDEASPRAD